MAAIKQAAIIGGGVIGAGWISRLIENGIDVSVYDPAADAAEKVEAVLKNSRYAYSKLISSPRSKEGSVQFCDSIAAAVASAELIVESVPERLDIKQTVYAEIEVSASSDALIASSTSGIMPSELQAKMEHPERLLVAMPSLTSHRDSRHTASSRRSAIKASISFFTCSGCMPTD